jgi:hypothetical protein
MWLSIAIGAAYGLSMRLLAGFHAHWLEVMSMSFICFMPIALGCISVYIAEIQRPQQVRLWFFLPWLSMLAALVVLLALALEGVICIVMLLPIGLPLASIGGALGGSSARVVKSRRAKRLTMACVMVLPLLASPWEQQVFYQWETRRVENTIDIQSPPEVIWRNIERVPPIRREELPPSWAHMIGIPDPIEATLSHEGIGGVRNGYFAKGVQFVETIDVWEPGRRLAFTIVAQTNKIPATTLDEHVTVGGPHFDMLRGEYRLETLAHGVTRLHLSSRHRVSTDFNWYAHLWTDAVMSDLQKRILYVLQQRCQAQAANISTPVR